HHVAGADDVMRQAAARLAAVPTGGVGFTELAFTEPALQALPAPPVRLNVIGDLAARGTSSEFTPAPESTGAWVSPARRLEAELDMLVQLVDGALIVEVGYSPRRWRQETMDALREGLAAALEEMGREG
ncbi:MAG TPA: hypothetical protein PKA64_24020, partial [Myxococcota bacterium]|nr:hypothetical protein [Myxococcota bacterium]